MGKSNVFGRPRSVVELHERVVDFGSSGACPGSLGCPVTAPQIASVPNIDLAVIALHRENPIRPQTQTQKHSEIPNITKDTHAANTEERDYSATAVSASRAAARYLAACQPTPATVPHTRADQKQLAFRSLVVLHGKAVRVSQLQLQRQ